MYGDHPWLRGPLRQRSTRMGIALIASALLLFLLAIVFLALGINQLVFVYLSILCILLIFPTTIFGIVLFTRRDRIPDGWRFNAPPGWPDATAWWRPEPMWLPDPSWPRASDDWQWWIPG